MYSRIECILVSLPHLVWPNTNLEHGYQIKAGDIIRFGRVRFYVRRISGNNDYQSNSSLSSKNSNSSEETEKENSYLNSQGLSESEGAEENDYGDVTNNNITINPAFSSKRVSNLKRFSTIAGNDNVLSELRKSYDSSLVFESQNGNKLNQVLDRRESFSQISMKKHSISYLPKGDDKEFV